MKIEWLNADRTEAIVTRGLWRWKRRARVRRVDAIAPNGDHIKRWEFLPSGRRVDQMHDWLEVRRMQQIERDGEWQDWQPDPALPEARLLK